MSCSSSSCTVRSLHHVPVLAAIAIVSACGSDSLSRPPVIDESELYWALDLNHHAVTLSMTVPYDTLTLHATPRTSNGAAIVGLATPRYISREAERLSVSSDGMLLALKSGGAPVTVIATLTHDDLVHTDSVLVNIVDNPAPPVLTSFSARPLPPDSAKAGASPAGFGWLDKAILPVRALDAGGAPIDGLLASFRSADTSVARIDPTVGQIVGQRPGSVKFYVSTTAFGVHKADTVPYRIGWPALGVVSVNVTAPVVPGGDSVHTYLPSEIRVSKGAMVLWQASPVAIDPVAVDVAFKEADQPNVAPASTFAMSHLITIFPFEFLCLVFGCDAGGDAPAGPGVLRVFPKVGTYEYHSALYGTVGRIVVIDDNASE